MAFGFGRGTSDLSREVGSRGITRATYASTQLMARAELTGDMGWSTDAFSLEPQIGMMWVRDSLKEFADSFGAAVGKEALTLVRIGIGPRVAWHSEKLTSEMQIRVNWDRSERGQAGSERSLSSDAHFRNRWMFADAAAIDLSVGLSGSGNSKAPAIFTTGLRYEMSF